MLKRAFSLILSFFTLIAPLSAQGLASPPSVTQDVIAHLKGDLEVKAYKVDDLLETLNAGLVALNDPQRIAKDAESLEKGKDLPKEDQVILKHIFQLCASHPEFSLKSIKTNAGFLAYKKILSAYTYTVEEAMKQSKETEKTLAAAVKAYENPEQTKSLWQRYAANEPLSDEERSFMENVGHIATLK